VVGTELALFQPAHMGELGTSPMHQSIIWTMTNFDEQQELKTKQHLFTGDLTTTTGAVQTGTASAQQDLHHIGEIIEGRYKILSLIGEGGVGRVYKAQQLATGRLVAIKMLHRHVLDDIASLRFHQEAKVASAINHPNAATIYDFGQSDSGELYLAMEYVEGEDLSSRIKRLGQLPPPDVVDIFLQITDALNEAHENGIIHRDLKPSNVMLARSKKRQNVVKILDFGIAKQMDRGEQSLTKTGEIFGTPLYMSPEQCKGEQLTPAADIYSIGCMLYEALTGVPPHVGSNFMSIMSHHCQEPVKKFAQVRPDLKIPAHLEAVTLTCLNKVPTDRFASIDELHARLLEGNRNKNQSPDSLMSLAHSSHRFKWFALMALPVAILITCFSYAIMQKSHESPPTNKTDLSPLTKGAPNLTHGQIMDLIDRARASQTTNKAHSMQTFEEAFVQAKKANDQQAILKIGLAYPEMLTGLNTASDREKAAEFFICLERAQKQLEPNLVRPRVQTVEFEAENYSNLKEIQNAIDCNVRAWTLLKTIDHSALDIIGPLSQVGNHYFYIGDYEKALVYYHQVKEIAKTAKPFDMADIRRQIAFNTSYEADIDKQKGRYASAIKKFRKAIDYPWKDDDQRWLPDMYAKLAECYQSLNQTDNAKQAWSSALSGARRWKLEDKIVEYKHRLESLSRER